MQWLLFTISTLDIVPDYTRQDMKNILQWIGHTLGIGQALVLADVSPDTTPVPSTVLISIRSSRQILVEACALKVMHSGGLVS